MRSPFYLLIQVAPLTLWFLRGGLVSLQHRAILFGEALKGEDLFLFGDARWAMPFCVVPWLKGRGGGGVF